MFGMTSAVLVRATAEAPESLLIGGGDKDTLTEIQEVVGGTIDAVRRGCLDTSGKNKNFILVGYVHDEGRIIDLPLNPVATVLFEQNIYGDVLLVSGTNPETGEYDGENYDVPTDFTVYVTTALHEEVSMSLMFSKMLATALSKAVEDEVVSMSEANKIIAYCEKGRDEGLAYDTIGSMPKELQDILKRAFMHSMLGDDSKGDDE
jgi:hypothetical protein